MWQYGFHTNRNKNYLNMLQSKKKNPVAIRNLLNQLVTLRPLLKHVANSLHPYITDRECASHNGFVPAFRIGNLDNFVLTESHHNDVLS